MLLFRKIGYFTDGEVRFVLDDLNGMLMKVEQLCHLRHFPDSSNEIPIFYSDISLYNDIHLIESSL